MKDATVTLMDRGFIFNYFPRTRVSTKIVCTSSRFRTQLPLTKCKTKQNKTKQNAQKQLHHEKAESKAQEASSKAEPSPPFSSLPYFLYQKQKRSPQSINSLTWRLFNSIY